ncbi:MAG TPA: hypothetical protein VFF06_00465 [Polyangia bacterium]|nr:hypothetical protein [Polyangia bacterium]
MFWIQPCAATKKHVEKKTKPAAPPPVVAGSECKANENVKLEVDFPPKVTEGDLLGIRVRTTCDAWLVVYYLEDKGPGAVLWPSQWEPAPRAGPSRPAMLLSENEARAGKALEAQLRARGVASHETFVVFAFADRDAFDRFKPAVGATDADGSAYAASLEKKLGELKPSRWAMYSARYTIEPKK